MITTNQSSKKITDITAYLVGGAVRDQLLERIIVERDYVVIGATVEQMLSLGFQQVGKDFPVFLHPKTKEEYALARTEKKQGKGYTGFTCHASPNVTLEQDLLRRDLTVNAMALTDSGEIIDPYNGQKDLSDRILRHVSPAFSEDPLRVLRVARFAARYQYLGFTVCPETMVLMRNISKSGELKALSSERIYKEMERSLTEQSPEVFFDILHQCEALKEIWPELNSVWSKHVKARLLHAAKLSSNVAVRFSALMLGNQSTKEKREFATQTEQIALRLKLPNEIKLIAVKATEITNTFHQAMELSPKETLALFDKVDVWRKPELLEALVLVAKADFRSEPINNKNAINVSDYPQAQYLLSLSEKLRAITAKPFVEQGLKGLAIKEAIYLARLSAIKTINAKGIRQ